MNRKDDHIHYALNRPVMDNAFDRMRLPYHSLPEMAVGDVNLSINIFNRTFPTPLFINAMTGGSDQAKTINHRLALLAKHFDLPMATGSLSASFHDSNLKHTFEVVRETNPHGFIIANLGAHHGIENVKKAIDVLNADAFEYHLNVPQELAMPEGDRSFQGWVKHISIAQAQLNIPFIVKEVGFGMSLHTIELLTQLGVQYINVGGRGGTNFSVIENERSVKPFHGLNEVGYSSVESLLFAQHVPGPTYVASGGIRSPLDVIKALVLGAKLVGMSHYFLQLVTQHTHEEAVEIVDSFLQECKAIMVTMGIREIGLLAKQPYFLDKTTLWTL
jgi:isopentenyl-diphosphate Delta-isomerase